MGTHNLLLRIGESIFLEVIAINPSAPSPLRPRWFGLDLLPAKTAPRLGTWVARTPDIRKAMMASTVPLGRPEPMSRGSLEWLISITEDGSLPLDGAAPVLIQWTPDRHPTTSLQDFGLRLTELEIAHPDPLKVCQLLRSLGIEDKVRIVASQPNAPVSLTALIETPQGLRKLSAPISESIDL